MQITSSLPASTSIYSTSTTTATASKPEDFLTDSDVKMIEYVSGTTSLDAAELDPNAKALAISLGTKRENGWVQGDQSQGYFYSQLTPSDAKMVESMTGTSNIIDALNAGGTDMQGFMDEIAVDRSDGSLTGNVTTNYLGNLAAFDQTQLSEHGGEGYTTSLDTLNKALAYVKANVDTGDSSANASSTYSATA